MTRRSSSDIVVHDAAKVLKLLGERRKKRTTPLDSPPEPRNGYVTFFDPGWSILRLRDAVEDKGQIFFPQRWYNNQAFARAKEEPCYRHLRLEAVKDSFGKSFA